MSLEPSEHETPFDLVTLPNGPPNAVRTLSRTRAERACEENQQRTTGDHDRENA